MALINFSLPIIPSFTKTEPDKLIPVKIWDGSLTQQLLFIPDIKILSNFVEGNLGIADGIMKKMLFKNISQIKNPEILKQFNELAGGKLKKPEESYFKDNKISVNPEDIELTNIPGNLGGLKSLEKSLIQSIFETQKPYMEIIKLVIENLVKIEDIIARVLAISGSSMNPKNNPKALGYQGNTDFLKKMAQLDALRNSDTGPKPPSSDSTPESNTADPSLSGNFKYVTQSVVYSTGQFDPNVNYTYIYEFAKQPQIKLGEGTFSIPPITDDEHLPERIVFAVFDSNWNLVDESLINKPYQEAKKDGSVDKNINWLNRSGKWFGRFDQIEEGKDYNYVKDIFDNKVFYVNDGPSVNVDGQTKFLKKGFPKIKNVNALESYYNTYYLDETRRRATKKGLSASQVQEVTNEISSKIKSKDVSGTSGIQTTVEGAIKNGFLNSSTPNNTTGLPGGQFFTKQNPFKPKKITYKGEQVWVDPEAKYDMKIIKCDSSKDITFLDIEPDNKKLKKTKILRFIKNTLSIKMVDESDFYYEISNPLNLPIPKAGKTAEISLDNTRGGGIFGEPSFQGAINGNITIFRKFMDTQYRNGIIFNLGGKNVRLSKFFDTWKIDVIYWSIDSAQRLGDILSLGLSGLPTERDGLGNRRVRVRFPNGIDYYFTTNDGQFLYRPVYRNINLSDIQPRNLEKVQILIDGITSTRTVSILPPNSIRVEDDRFKFGKLISNTQILNDKLADTKKAFGKGPYGTPITVDNKNLSKQNIEQIYRFQQTEDDTETYFIIEGILSSKNKQKLNGNGRSNGNSDQLGGGDYSFPDVIGVIPVFIEMLIDIFAKLIPTITSLLTLISNPAKFVTDIIIAKIGDNNGTEPEKFGIFSKKFQDDLKKLSQVSEPGFKDESERLEKRNKLKDFISKSKLNNYVYVRPDAFPKFVLDGVSTIKLFGDAPILQKLPSIVFGLEVKLTNLALAGKIPPPNFEFGNTKSKASALFSQLTGTSAALGESVNNTLNSIKAPDLQANLSNTIGNISDLMPFKLIFQYFAPTSNDTLADLSGLTKPNKQQTPSNLGNSNFNPVLDIPSELLTKANNNFVYEIVDVQYSTGKKVSGIDYKYVYIYKDLQKTILEAQKLDEAGETSSALALLEDAQKKDPNNGLLKDLIDELKKKLSDSVQPIIKFLLELVCLPLKIVVGIITYIMDLFKSFLNPFELVVKIIEFVSFKWMLDFFNPTSKNSIFAILGMKFDIQTFLTSFIPNLLAGVEKTSDITLEKDDSTTDENKKNEAVDKDFEKDNKESNTSKEVPSETNSPGLKQKFDMSKIIDMPFFAGKLPTYSRKQFDLFFNLRNGTSAISLPTPALPKLPSIPTLLLSSILCLIEAIINSIIDLIWGILGLGSLIPAPHLKLCKDSNQNLDANDIAKLLSGGFDDPSKDVSYNFVFNIQTSDGRNIRDLNREELDKWLEENKDLQVSFNF